MALVAVINIRMDPHCFKRPYSTNPEYQLLPQPVLVITPVQVVCNGPVFGGVILAVGVKQHETYLAYMSFPYSDLDGSTRPDKADNQVISLTVLNRKYRQS